MKQIALILFIASLLGCGPRKAEELHYFDDLSLAMEESRKTGKPLFINFSGFALSFDQFTRTFIHDRKIVRTLNDDYVTTILYVDDRDLASPAYKSILQLLDTPDAQAAFRDSTTSRGRVNALLQYRRFRSNTQPMYCITNANLRLLTGPQTYIKDSDTERLLHWLRNKEMPPEE